MAKNTVQQYTQCTLEKYFGDVRLEQVSWIPSQMSKLGKHLSLKNSDGEWEDGWRVIQRGNTLSAEYVESHERDGYRYRENNDY